MLEASLADPDSFVQNCRELFRTMAERNGRLGYDRIEWFNGGLFNDDEALPLTHEDIKVALSAANQDWSNIDPSIMGTLFERGLDPGKRSQFGAHEHLGERYLVLGDLAKAQEHLAALERICLIPCVEMGDLERAIAMHRQLPAVERTPHCETSAPSEASESSHSGD